VRLLGFGGIEKTYHAWDYASKDDMKKYGRRYNPCGLYYDENGNVAYYDNQIDNYVQHNIQLHVSHNFNHYLRLNATLHYTKGDGYYEQYKTNRSLVEYGLVPFYINGEEVEESDLIRKKAMDNGFALVTEERRSTGIFPQLSISFNSVISNMDSYKVNGCFLSDKKISTDTKWVIESMNVKTPSQKTPIGTLSGGNQQKVIIGRWLLTNPEILMLDEPTRGIDVGAKYEIYQLINELASKDKGIIMISSEMPELIGVTDRILVMSNGRVAGIVDSKETTQEEIMKLSTKFTEGENNEYEITN
jgi:ABC-type cobalamin/Fe3+-siderophores transport system ATPase subunit